MMPLLTLSLKIILHSHITTIMIGADTHCLLTHHCLMFHPPMFTDSVTPTCNIPCLPKYEQLLPATVEQQKHSFVIHYFAFRIPFVETADPCSINTRSTSRKLKAFYKIHHKVICYCQRDYYHWVPYSIQYNQKVCIIPIVL